MAKIKLLILALAQKKMQITPHTALMKLITVSQDGLPSAEPLTNPCIIAQAAISTITVHINHSYHVNSWKLFLRLAKTVIFLKGNQPT